MKICKNEVIYKRKFKKSELREIKTKKRRIKEDVLKAILEKKKQNR